VAAGYVLTYIPVARQIGVYNRCTKGVGDWITTNLETYLKIKSISHQSVVGLHKIITELIAI
jgi:hypothetical protein